LGWGSLGLALLGLGSIGLGLFFPPAAGAAPILFGASGVLGVASGVASISSRLSRDRVNARGVLMDILGIAASLLTMGGAAFREVARSSTRLATSQRMVTLGALGAESLEGVFIGLEYADSLAAILSSSGSRAEKRRQLILLLAQAAATAGLMIASTRQGLRDLDHATTGSRRLASEPDWWAHELSSDDRGLLRRTARMDQLDEQSLAAERRLRDRRTPRRSGEPGYDVEVDLGNGHVWRRRERDAQWCRFSRKFCEPVPPGVADDATFPSGVSVPSHASVLAFRRRRQTTALRGRRGWTGDMEAQYRGYPPAGEGYQWVLRTTGDMKIERISARSTTRRVALWDGAGELAGFQDGTGFIEATTIPLAEPWEVSGPATSRRLAGLNRERDAARTRRDRARRAATRSAAHGEMVAATEQLGEVAGEAWVRSRLLSALGLSPSAYHAPSRLFRGSGRDVVDMVFEIRPRHGGQPLIVVIEAKGAGGRLGVRATDAGLAQQGTWDYLQSVTAAMRDQGGTAMDVAARIERARRLGTLHYILTHAAAGSPTTVRAERFNL
jgi:hypothetical protein